MSTNTQQPKQHKQELGPNLLIFGAADIVAENADGANDDGDHDD